MTNGKLGLRAWPRQQNEWRILEVRIHLAGFAMAGFAMAGFAKAGFAKAGFGRRPAALRLCVTNVCDLELAQWLTVHAVTQIAVGSVVHRF